MSVQYTQDVLMLIMASIVMQIVMLLMTLFVFIETPYFLFKKGLKQEFTSAMRYLQKFNGVSEHQPVSLTEDPNFEEEELPLVLAME